MKAITFGSLDDYVIPKRDYDDNGDMLPTQSDFDLCEKADQLFKFDPKKKITFKCLNNKEKEMIKRLMEDLYPDVLIHFSVQEDESDNKTR